MAYALIVLIISLIVVVPATAAAAADGVAAAAVATCHRQPVLAVPWRATNRSGGAHKEYTTTASVLLLRPAELS